MLKSGLRTSCATPATIEPISAIVSLCRSCSLSRTVSVTSWKLSTARRAPSPSGASARALTTQVRRVSGSFTSRAAGCPPGASVARARRAPPTARRGPELGERLVDELGPARAAGVLDRGAVDALDAARRRRPPPRRAAGRRRPSRHSTAARRRSASRPRRSISAAARAAKTWSTPSGRTTSSSGRSWIAFTSPSTSPLEARSATPT